MPRQHGVNKVKDSDSIEKQFVALLRRSEESVLGRILVEGTILLSASRNASQVLHDAVVAYKVSTDAIALRVRQEFAAKDKAKKSIKLEPKPVSNAKKAA